MNKEHINKIIKAILSAEKKGDKTDLGFDMSYFYDERKNTSHTCGTAMCIAGWSKHLNDAEDFEDEVDLFSEKAGITLDNSNQICLPNSYEDSQELCTDLCYITAQDAVKMLQNFMKTGEVDWSHVRERDGYGYDD